LLLGQPTRNKGNGHAELKRLRISIDYSKPTYGG